MFHAERLTGKRRRKYLASITYAPQFEKIPKHLLKVIRAPAEHVKYIKMIMPKVLGARTAHHVAVIRHRIVMLNHDTEIQAGEKAMAELAGTKDWRCTCYDVCDMYATHTKLRRVRNDKQKRALAHATAKHDLPEDMIELRLRCRRPRTQHRTAYLDKERGFDTGNGDTTYAPYVPPKQFGEKLIAARVPHKIKTRAAEVLAAALGDGVRVNVNWTSTDVAAGECQLNVRSGVFAASWGVYLDPCAWFSRIYHHGLHVLGDWFVTNATRWHGKVDQQEGVDLVVREYNKTPSALGVCQPATAVNLTWLRRPCTFSGGRVADVVAGVIARPFPGAAWFLPLPKWGADAWSPRVSSHYATYKFDLNTQLAKPYTTEKAREAARQYAATRLPPGVAIECPWPQTLEIFGYEDPPDDVTDQDDA